MTLSIEDLETQLTVGEVAGFIGGALILCECLRPESGRRLGLITISKKYKVSCL